MNLDQVEKARLYDQTDAGVILGPPGQPLSRNGLFQLRKKGAIGFVRRGRRIFFKGEHLLQYLEGAERKRKGR
jgi:hypothetical protein